MLKIILEGADNVGKTTIAEWLGHYYRIKVRDRIIRTNNYQVIPKHFEDLAVNTDCIFDRCYAISDWIYEPLTVQKNSMFYIKNMRDIMEQHLRDNDIFLIHITCDIPTLQRRYDANGDDIFSFNKILEARDRYIEYFEECTIPFLTVNNTLDTPRESTNKIIYYIDEQNRNRLFPED